MATALEHRRLDVGIVTSFTPCANSDALPLYWERLTAELPVDHALAERDAVEWDDLLDETILIQEWDDSQAMRELNASLLGQSARFHPHPRASRVSSPWSPPVLE